MALNKILLIGHVGKDPEIQYLATPDHPKVAQFTLATTERMKSRGGEVRELTEWHNILAWRALADIVEKYVKKGMQVYIEGQGQDEVVGVQRAEVLQDGSDSREAPTARQQAGHGAERTASSAAAATGRIWQSVLSATTAGHAGSTRGDL